MTTRSRPAFGSTAWGAEKIMRILRREAEEQAIAEEARRRLAARRAGPMVPAAECHDVVRRR